MKKSMTELRNEIVGFPLSQRIDVLDALSFGTYFFETPSQQQTAKKETMNPFSLEAIMQELNEQTSGELPFPEQLGRERTFLE